jgi:hypothetical protein
MIMHFLEMIMHFLEMIWHSTSFSLACPSTLDPLERFEELPEKDLELPGFLFLPFDSGSPGKI